MSIWKIILFVIVAFIFFIIFRFVLLPTIDFALTSVTHKTEAINFREFQTKEECVKNGGDWRRPGPWPKEICRKKMDDSGKICIAGFQCKAGSCLTEGSLRNEALFAVGKCPTYTLFFGCIQKVHFGFTSNTICLD